MPERKAAHRTKAARWGSKLLLAALLALGIVSPRQARAQATITLASNAVVIKRAVARPESQSPRQLNRQDCIEDVEVSFPLKLTGSFQSYSLEVWAALGSNKCTQEVERTGSNKHCWPVWTGTPTGTPTLKVHARKLIDENDTCSARTTPDSPQDISVYFMLVTAAEPNAEARAAVWTSKFDTIGPAPPTEVSTGIGEERLIVKWKALTGDISSYDIYCEAVADARSSGLLTAAGAAGASGTGAAGSGGNAGSSGDAGAGGEAGSGGSAGSSGSSGAGGSGGSNPEGTVNDECPTPLLRAGVAPHPTLKRCGNVQGATATEGTAKGLTNGLTYAVAAAAVDKVGNAGPLSDIACGEPQPIDDFFEMYRRAGGKGGGGFCAFSGRPGSPSLGTLLVLGLVALGLRRRQSC